ncbi:MAG TPA: 16S rRNA (cytidine(1402)-2'-O)-methyltransferase [Thermoanaerobaculia bacterium]|nr:16S rRNA (cytidine(1402)-2'-O)-methyltransferase [Thermoanaerobaculia bacterium]
MSAGDAHEPSTEARAPGDRRGTLWVVSTPIGNLGDLTPRAAEVLGTVDVVACEDTRRTGRLLQHLGLRKTLRSLHEHNERARVREILQTLEQGRDVALVSDAGTPLLSDPGFLVVREAATAGLTVRPLPGPSAALAALVVSGLPPYPFTMLGFPPPRSGRRQSFLRRFAELAHTLVLFESPHRLLASLDDAIAVLGDRPAAIARELTKLHEEVLRGTLRELRDELGARPKLQGEFVVVVGGSAQARSTERQRRRAGS